jgi:hypothetical protein
MCRVGGKAVVTFIHCNMGLPMIPPVRTSISDDWHVKHWFRSLAEDTEHVLT